ncbi:hypothetical protein K6V39_07205 [Streptococcus suis]|uniref:hypothetical protein n=1 Tax=Streptococcus suis TaxID=1307 RepID=UPI00040530E7|nr:hypothetical protein [Streptococcus suis]AZR97254.1 hypothetical protein A7J10_05145 [Streptococcus suis]AZR97977.1 hypothetical protein A7J10_09105 [Streptococcus suis]KPA62687.1 hypothetical protein XK27_12385 [Streptococcus suis]MBY4962379.1 hypothetical protein [Streptococcus suis]MBY4968713.1 hypothetical protein [Streptococcus suis]
MSRNIYIARFHSHTAIYSLLFSTNRDAFECTIGVFSSLAQTTEAIQQFVTFSDINRLIEANDLVTITKIEDYMITTIAEKQEEGEHNEDGSVKNCYVESITIEGYKLNEPSF